MDKIFSKQNCQHQFSWKIKNIERICDKCGFHQIGYTIQKKSDVMIPEQFALGMIKRGWILRNNICWYKKNHLPESVTDRLTKAHEVIYHFVKQGTYYYNLDAIREPHKDSSMERYQRPLKMGGAKYAGKVGFEIYSGKDWKPKGYSGKFDGANDVESFGSPRARTQRNRANTGDNNKEPYQQNNPHTIRLKGADYQGKWKEDEEYMNKIQQRINDARASGVPHDVALNHPLGKNPGDVWEINTQPYAEAHFATFSLELVRRPILAGCPVGGIVLDPFAGSGTVGEFCRHNDRNAILFELNPNYKQLIIKRTMLDIPSLESYFEPKPLS